MKHVEALGYVDLRIERPGNAPQFLAGISPVEFRSMQPTLEEQGAAIFVHARNAQLIREVPINLVAEASKRGFEPAAAVMTRPGFCDIWMHHGNYTDADPRIALFLKRSICMEYSASLERSASYGKLATRPDELIVATGQSFSRSGELRKFFGFHLSEQRKTFEGACRAVGVPPLAEFRRAHGFASTPALDSMWMQIALKAGVPTDQALANIACDGARSLALSPRASVQYAVRILEQGLRSARGLSGRALAAAVLNSIATAASISVKALRIAGVALALVSGRRVGH